MQFQDYKPKLGTNDPDTLPAEPWPVPVFFQRNFGKYANQCKKGNSVARSRYQYQNMERIEMLIVHEP